MGLKKKKKQRSNVPSTLYNFLKLSLLTGEFLGLFCKFFPAPFLSQPFPPPSLTAPTLGGFHFMREGPLHSCLPVPTMMPSLQKELSKFFLNEWHTIYLLKVNIFTNATL